MFHGSVVEICAQSQQGMKKSRDDFYVITNEIGGLIELTVQYARERKPTSQRFVAVCGDFLR